MSIAIPAEDPRQVPNRVTIDTAAITANTQAIRSLLEEQTALMAVVKADGYGHGMLDSARAALAGGATWLGVAHPASALALYRAGIDVPILTWLLEPTTARELLPDLVEAGIDISVGSPQMLRMVSEAAQGRERRARVHLKVDSGMGRGGVHPGAVRAVGVALREDDHVNLVGAWTHLASGEDPDDPFTEQQVETFDRCVEALADSVGPVPLQHIAASASTILRPHLHRDIVRCGLSLYGYSPVPTDLQLRPAMSLTSRLAMVKSVPAGQSIGYGHTRITVEPTKLGLIPIGYADGLPIAASDQVSVLIRHEDGTTQRALQLGRISMDQIVVDLGPDSAAQPGDEVVIFGADGAPSAEAWAIAAGTIPYEILTSVSGRVPREVR